MTADRTDEAIDATIKEMATRMMYAADLFALNHKQRVGNATFNDVGPSKPGEYPHLRSGAGQKNVTHDGTSVQAVIDNGLVIRIGEQAGGWYMIRLELGLGRLGFLNTADDLRSTIVAAVGVAAS